MINLLELKRIIKRQPWMRNSMVYSLCKKYVDFYNCENNLDMVSNGEVYLLEQYLPKSQVIFDVGANIGQWSNFATKLKSNINLHCFEPNQSAFDSLSLCREHNFPQTNVVLNHLGLDSYSGEKTLYVLFECSQLNSFWQREELNNAKQEIIQVDSLDNYCERHQIETIDFLKIDVEGHELEVLKGAKQLLAAQKINLIQFEYNTTHIDARIFLKDFFELFKGLNYSFYKLYPNHLQLVEKYDVILENFQYQNWSIIKHGW